MSRPRLRGAAALILLALPLWAASAGAQEAGRDQFMASCSVCHQPTGVGIRGAFPALAGDALLQGDPSRVAAVVLNGRAGMPSFKADLSDAQIAAALTYARSAWGNHAAPISPADVAAVRSRADAGQAAGLQAH